MKVTPATYTNHDEIVRLTRAPELKHVRDFSNKFMSGPDAYAKQRILVVRDKGAIVGFVSVNHRVIRGGYSSINFIGVASSHQGKGIAKALVAEALKRSPWKVLHAHVAESNMQAIAWYTRTKWSVIGHGAWKTKGPYVIMEKTA